MSTRKASTLASLPSQTNRLDAVLAAGICNQTAVALTAMSLSTSTDAEKFTSNAVKLSHLQIGVNNAKELPDEVLRQISMLTTRMEEIAIPIEVKIRPQAVFDSITNDSPTCISIQFHYGKVMVNTKTSFIREWYLAIEEKLSRLDRYYAGTSTKQKAVINAITGASMRSSNNFQLTAKFINSNSTRYIRKRDTIEDGDTLVINGKWFRQSQISDKFDPPITPIQQLFLLCKDIIIPSEMIQNTFQQMMPAFMVVESKLTLQKGIIASQESYQSEGVYHLMYTRKAKHQRRKELFNVLSE